VENDHNLAGQAKDEAGPAKKTLSDVSGDEHLNTEKVAKQTGGRGQGLLGRVRARLQAIGTPHRASTLPAGDTLTQAPPPADEISEEAAKTGNILAETAKWTRRRDIPLAILAWSGVVLLVLWAAGHVTRTILVLVIASLLAYSLAPLVTFLERVMPRVFAILIVYLIVLGGISTILYFVIHTASEQITSLSHYLRMLLTPGTAAHPSSLEQSLRPFGISASQIASARDQILASTTGLAGDIVPLLTGIINVGLDFIVVAVLSIYLLIDGARVGQWLRRSMPRRQRGRVRFLLETLQRIVGGYIRGQIVLCVLIGLLVGVGMGIIGVPYALLLGVLAFVLEFIPILGTLASGVICVLLALTKGWLIALIVLVYFVLVHILEGDIIGPRIVGKAVGLHPAVALVALIAGGELFGIWGVLLASPVAGVLQAFLVAIWSEWRETHPQEFERTANKIAKTVEENVAEKPVDPEPAAKLLSEAE
jgi:predicted PurR-regulated permease PerM